MCAPGKFCPGGTAPAQPCPSIPTNTAGVYKNNTATSSDTCFPPCPEGSYCPGRFERRNCPTGASCPPGTTVPDGYTIVTSMFGINKLNIRLCDATTEYCPRNNTGAVPISNDTVPENTEVTAM